MKNLKMGLSVAALALAGALADSYAIDPVHSTTVFRIKHLNTAYVYGRFDGPEGTVNYDPAAPEQTTFDVTLQAAKIDTGNDQRDNHLKSPAFFNAKEFATLTFKSTGVKKGDDTTLEVTGDLTIHGVTKSVTVKVDVTGMGKDPKGNPVVGFESTFVVNRNDYGITEFPGMLG